MDCVGHRGETLLASPLGMDLGWRSDVSHRLVSRVLAAVLCTAVVSPLLTAAEVPSISSPPRAAADEVSPDAQARPLGQPLVTPVQGFVPGVSVDDRSLWTASSRTW